MSDESSALRPTSLHLHDFGAVSAVRAVNSSGTSQNTTLSRSLEDRFFAVRQRHNIVPSDDEEDDELPTTSAPADAVHSLPGSPVFRSGRRTTVTPKRSLTPIIYGSAADTLESPSNNRPISPLILGRKGSLPLCIRQRRLNEIQGRERQQREFNRIEAAGERSIMHVRAGALVETKLGTLQMNDCTALNDLEDAVKRKRARSLTEPITIDVHTSFVHSAASSPNSDSPNVVNLSRPPSAYTDMQPTTSGINSKQCYSPATQQMVRSNIAFSPSASPAPSPTRPLPRHPKRSLSPIASRPPLKRKMMSQVTREDLLEHSKFARQNSGNESDTAPPTPKRLLTERFPTLPPSPLAAGSAGLDGRPSSRSSTCSSIVSLPPPPTLFGTSSANTTAVTSQQRLSSTSLGSATDVVPNERSNNSMEEGTADNSGGASASHSPFMFSIDSPTIEQRSASPTQLPSVPLPPTPMHSPQRDSSGSNMDVT